MKLGIYVHIPFCRQKCRYCDFPSYAGMEALYEDYLAALCREIDGKGGLFSHSTVDTVFIGGGTPTLLAQQQLERLLDALQRSFVFDAGAEITIEANPGTVSRDKLKSMQKMGINRISFGVQSFNDSLLREIGRIHTAVEAVEAVCFARQAGFDNINIDLISGLPRQTLADWQDTLRQAVDLEVQHISAYGLKVEDGTPFAAAAAAGTLRLPDEEEDEAMYDLTTEWLPGQGFFRYEISNYARPGRECRHNLKYWRYEPYLGLGAAAHSFSGGCRTANTADVAQYVAKLLRGDSPVEFSEDIGRDTAMSEFVFLALRTVGGVAFSQFSERFGMTFTACFGQSVEKLKKMGLIEVGKDGLWLTPRGMKYGNVAFEEFLI